MSAGQTLAESTTTMARINPVTARTNFGPNPKKNAGTTM